MAKDAATCTVLQMFTDLQGLCHLPVHLSKDIQSYMAYRISSLAHLGAWHVVCQWQDTHRPVLKHDKCFRLQFSLVAERVQRLLESAREMSPGEHISCFHHLSQ